MSVDAVVKVEGDAARLVKVCAWGEVMSVSGSEVYVVNNKATRRPHRVGEETEADWLKL